MTHKYFSAAIVWIFPSVSSNLLRAKVTVAPHNRGRMFVRVSRRRASSAPPLTTIEGSHRARAKPQDRQRTALDGSHIGDDASWQERTSARGRSEGFCSRFGSFLFSWSVSQQIRVRRLPGGLH